jgi:hypothetical protein
VAYFSPALPTSKISFLFRVFSSFQQCFEVFPDRSPAFLNEPVFKVAKVYVESRFSNHLGYARTYYPSAKYRRAFLISMFPPFL